MPRRARIVIPGLPFHVTQRGIDRMRIFVDDDDRRDYWRWLLEASDAHGVAIHAYVLMGNHVHLLATPAREDSLGRAMKRCGQIYAQAFNRRYRRCGALLQGRFFSSPVGSERHFLEVLRYIELNPVRAGMVRDPLDHAWSSVHVHLGRRADALVRPHAEYLRLGNTPADRIDTWREWLRRGIDEDSLATLRRRLRQGRAVGSDEFVASLASRFGPGVAWRPQGRPSQPGSEAACTSKGCAGRVVHRAEKGNVPF